MFLKLSMIVTLIISSYCSYANLPPCNVIERKNIKTLPLDPIKDYVQTFVFEQSNVPALMIGIISGEEQAVISCGETVKGNQQRPAMNTIWSIGSVSKVFTTQMLGELVNQGVVKLTTTVDELLNNEVTHDAPITLLDLATHTSGFPNLLPTMPDNEDYQVNNPYKMDDFVSWYTSYIGETKPGTHYQYSNVGYGILGQLLAKKMNVDFNTLLYQLISQPLGMNDTTVNLTRDQKNRKVASYWLNGDLILKDWDMGFETPSGGIYSSMNDMIKFTQYHLNQTDGAQINNQITHASYVYQYQLDNPLGFDSDAMALGWSVDYPTHGIPLQLMKNGWVNGVNTYVQLTPTANIGLVSFTNKPYLNINYDLKKIVAMIIAAQKTP